MSNKRILYIDPTLAQEASNSVESLDALALVLSMKLTFVSSCLHNASATNIMRTFGIGHTRYKRSMDYALSRGWLVREGDRLRATAIKKEGAYNIRLQFDKVKSGKTLGKLTPVKAAYTLTQMRNIIRQAVLLYHISKQSVVYDTITMATQPQEGASLTAHKQAVKRAKGWGMRKSTIAEGGCRLSYARMAELASCSKSKAKGLMKPLVQSGVVSQTENYLPTIYSIGEYSKALRDNYAKLGGRGFIVGRGGRVLLRLANSYAPLRAVVKFVKNYRTKTA